MSPGPAAAPAPVPHCLILPGAEVAALMGQADWLAAVETGFRAAAAGQASAPPPMTLAGIGGAFHAKGATLLLGRPFVALKLNGNFPDNPRRGLPTIQGAILFCDGGTGALLAVIDSIEVTLRRTAAATALAARHLARPDSRRIMICGCGAQAQAQLEALRFVLPLQQLLAWDRGGDRARRLAAAAGAAGLEARAVGELGEARECDVIVTCTTSREPFLTPAHVAPGTFVAAVGADSPDKSEIAPDLFRQALVVADVLEQCREIGDLRHALGTGAIGLTEVHAELGELVSGAKAGRVSAEQITLFDSTGTAIQDVACAALIYERALVRPGFPSFHFGATE